MPAEFVPAPEEVPVTVIKPVLVVTMELLSIVTPLTSSIPFAAVPVIVTSPVPVAEMLEDVYRVTPEQKSPVPFAMPVTVIEPELVVTVVLAPRIPWTLYVPHAAAPVIVTWPVPVDEMLEKERKMP